MSKTHTSTNAQRSKECWITLPKKYVNSSVQETGFSGYAAEQREMLSRTEGMESRSHNFPQIIGEVVRLLNRTNVVILTLDR